MVVGLSAHRYHLTDSKKYIEESLAGVEGEDRYKILAGNAIKLYNL